MLKLDEFKYLGSTIQINGGINTAERAAELKIRFLLRFVNVVKEDTQTVGVTEQDARDRVRWRLLIRCGDSWKEQPREDCVSRKHNCRITYTLWLHTTNFGCKSGELTLNCMNLTQLNKAREIGQVKVLNPVLLCKGMPSAPLNSSAMSSNERPFVSGRRIQVKTKASRATVMKRR